MQETTGYQFVLIEEDMKQDFGGVLPAELVPEENRVCIGIVDEEGEILGAISYSLIAYEYLIDWVYVVPPMRRKGIASLLLNQVLETVMGTGDLFPVSARFPYTDEDHAAFALFQSNEEMMVNYLYDRYLLGPEEIKNAKNLHVSLHLNIKTTPFFDLPRNRQDQILMELEQKHGYVTDSYERWKRNMIPEFCQCIFAEDELLDLVLVEKLLDRSLSVSFAYSKNGKGLIAILAAITAVVEKKYPNMSLTFDTINERSRQLAEKIFPQAQPIPIYEAVFL